MEMKKLLLALLSIALIFSQVGCAQNKSAQTPAKTIVIGIMPDVESIPFIIAEKNGYFTEEGVSVKIEAFKSAKDRDAALQSGQLDGVISDMLAVVFANEGGINLKMVAKDDGNIQLIAGQDSGISKIQDIKGRQVGLSTNTIMEYTVDRMLESAQISPDEIKKNAIPPLNTRLLMLQEKKIDAAILPEPLSTLAVMKNGARVLNSTDQMASKAGVIAFRASTLQDNREQVKVILRAYNKAVEYLQKEPVGNYIDFVIEKQSFPKEVRDIIKLPQYTKAEPPSEKTFADVLRWLKDKNLIKGTYEYKSLVDDSVLR